MSKERFEGSELLHAYVDGELSSADKERVEQWLETHPEDAKRVQEWQKQKDGVQFLFADKAGQDVPEYLLPGRPPQSPSTMTVKSYGLLSRIAAALLLLTTGSLSGWFGHEYLDSQNSPFSIAQINSTMLTTPAMEAHWVYTPEVKHPVEVTSDEQTHLAKWLSYRLEEPLTIPDLSTNGFQLMGGRLLPSRTGPAAQFMYESTEGRRVTVYLSKFAPNAPAENSNLENSKTHEIAFQFQESGSTRAFYWYDGPLGYVVIGDIAHEELSKIANSIFKQL